MGSVAIEPHAQRVIDEKRELDERLTKLTAFLDSEGSRKLGKRDQQLMRMQQDAMAIYSHVLGERLALWGN